MVTSSDGQAVSVGVLFGRNAKSLRQAAGVSLDDIARGAGVFGVRWTVSRVHNIESGRSTPSINTMLIYVWSLNLWAALDPDSPGGNVRLADLFAGDDDIQIAEGVGRGFALKASALQRMFAGGSANIEPGDSRDAPTLEEIPDRIRQTFAELTRANAEAVPHGSRLPPGTDKATLGFIVSTMTGLTDQRAAKRLGINVYELTEWSRQLWKSTFARERDLRAGDNANAQRKGQITRDLLAEVRIAIEKSERGND